MATNEHLKLSTFIKNVHSDLRSKSKILGYTEAWNGHCKNQDCLKKYALSMKELATKYWTGNSQTNSKIVSRIEWIYLFCNQYFYNGDLQKQRIKEELVLNKIEKVKVQYTTYTENLNINLLDVGSCYNPFNEFKSFNVVPIDIAPASEDVYKCDFINVSIGPETVIKNNTIPQLAKETFHIVVFSLLLEYLPSPEQRLICCRNAYNLLDYEGLLAIITPDSRHVGANAKYMKSWRYILSLMGFSRIKYEKLPYLHCMIFRKSISCEVTRRWSKLHRDHNIFDGLYIPQDFQEIDGKVIVKNEEQESTYVNYFTELPFG